MDTQIATIDTNNYDLMAEVMGIPQDTRADTGSGPSLCRMRVWNQPVMGTVNQDGKNRKMEVVPGGTFRFDDGSGNFLYAETIAFRPFLQRFRFSRWLPYATPNAKGKKGRFVKSVFTHDYKVFTTADLMDEDGTFNCGRPSGFIKNWKDLPEDSRKLITSVKRVRAIFGTVSLDKAQNAQGEEVSMDGIPMPVIWEIENNTAFKIMGEVLQKYRAAGHLFPQHEISLSTTGAPMANGNMLYQPVPEVDLTKTIDIVQAADSAVLAAFQTWVQNYNGFILESYKSKSVASSFTPEEQETIDTFITVEDT
tara:strand:- start:901 stop:1827 length:927 start_codon:yes stop_codon:yes gene_type:complete